MKKIMNLLQVLTCTAIGSFGLLPASFATIHEITVGGATFTFEPSNLSVFPGDTIRWVGAGGFHTTTSTLIPAGATAWDAPITTVGATFDYVPTEIGEYAYQCTPHSAMMTGTFTVSLPTPV